MLLGVSREDGPQQAERLAAKVRALRVFPDAGGPMNAPLGEREILCVSQFTLYGDTRRGNRPSFVAAAPGEQAEPLYELFCELTGAEQGRVRRPMQVELVNDGPVTLMLELASIGPARAQRSAQACSGASSSSRRSPSPLSA